jgi:hypothetical protein
MGKMRWPKPALISSAISRTTSVSSSMAALSLSQLDCWEGVVVVENRVVMVLVGLVGVDLGGGVVGGWVGMSMAALSLFERKGVDDDGWFGWVGVVGWFSLLTHTHARTHTHTHTHTHTNRNTLTHEPVQALKVLSIHV